MAEVFVSRLSDDFYDDDNDVNQFGSVIGRSTTLALVKLFHELFEASDNSNNIIRILFVDFSRAFDVVNHNVIKRKLEEKNSPVILTNWLLSFLNNREQFVRVNDRNSDCLVINAGAPQGTRAGPNCFKLLIRDLSFRIPYIKYVDDVSVVSISSDANDDSLQQALRELLSWCAVNGMHLNTNKTKEMILTFSKRLRTNNYEPLMADSVSIERVTDFKILGVIISADLSWSKHVRYIVSKASKRFFAICQLVRCGFASDDILKVYPIRNSHI